MYFAYVLVNPTGKFYIGSTDDLQRRVAEHNSNLGNLTFTHKKGPWTLAWSEAHPTRAAAMTREKQIKSMKSRQWIVTNLLTQTFRATPHAGDVT
jgi:predicted GIY-YIG superfamily endonuclease